MDEKQKELIEQVKMDVCDKLCRFPFQLDQEELEDKCAECPLNRFEVSSNG